MLRYRQKADRHTERKSCRASAIAAVIMNIMNIMDIMNIKTLGTQTQTHKYNHYLDQIAQAVTTTSYHYYHRSGINAADIKFDNITQQPRHSGMWEDLHWEEKWED